MSGLLAYLSDLWRAVNGALWFDSEVLQGIHDDPGSLLTTLGVAVVGGASVLLGQSVVLFANRVRPFWFLLSLFVNGFLFAAGLLVWAAVTWLIASWWLAEDFALSTAVRIIFLTAAPMVFGFLALLPYFGQGILRLLSVWSFLIALRVIGMEYSLTTFEAFLLVSVGWVMILALSHTVGRPVLWARDQIWKWTVGTTPNMKIDDVVRKLLQEHGLPVPEEDTRHD